MHRARPLRLLYLRDTLTVCGPGKTILNTWRTLDREQYALQIAATEPARGQRSAFLDAARELGAPVHPFAIGRGIDLGAVRRLVALIRAERIDLLQTHDAQSRRLGVIAAGITGVPHVCSVHGWIFNDRKEQLARWVDRFLLRKADAVIVVSGQLRRELAEAGIADRRMTVLHNAIVLGDYPGGAASQPLRQELGIPAEAPVVSIVGRLSPEKGHGDFLAAAARIVTRIPAARFLVVGDGPMRDSLPTRVAELGLNGRVIFVGHQSDLAPYYAVTDVLAIASYTEGVPNVLLEAFAHGKPAVATAVGGIPEVLDEGQTGFLVAPNEPEALADRLSVILENPQLRMTLGRAARGTIERRFSFEARTTALEHLYEGLLKSRSGGNPPPSATRPSAEP